MRALVAAPRTPTGIDLREVAEPDPAPHQAVVAMRAFTINAYEATLVAAAPEGFRPGWDIAGEIVRRGARVRPPGRHAGGGAGRAELGGARRRGRGRPGPVAGRAGRRGGGHPRGRRPHRPAGAPPGRRAPRAARPHHGGDRRRRAVCDPTGGAGGGARHGRRPRPGGRRRPSGARRGGDRAARAAGGRTTSCWSRSAATCGRRPSTLDIADFYPKHGARLVAFIVQESGRPYGLDLAYLAALAGGGRLVPPPIAREAGWREAGAVLTALRRGAIAGKAVLRPD